MKFRKPTAGGNAPQGVVTGRPRVADWLKEWLENQGKWCLLDCGCKEAWDVKSLCIIHRFGPKVTEIWCERCQKFVLWKNWIGFNNYMNIPPAVTPDEPLF